MNIQLEKLKVLTDQLRIRPANQESLDVVAAIHSAVSDVIATELREVLLSREELRAALEALRATQVELNACRHELEGAKDQIALLVQKLY